MMQKIEGKGGGAASPAPRRRSRRTQEGALWVFLVPSLLVISCVLLVPLGYAVYLSFTNFNLTAPTTEFVGLANYQALFGEERFWSSLIRTVFIVTSAVGLEFCLGLAIAYGLYKLTFGAKSLLMLVFIPYVITPTVAALFLRWMLMGRFGLISGTIMGLGFYPPDFLGSAGWAQFTVVLADAWQFTPFMVLTLYAGLNTVDTSTIEAAKMDGAGPLTILFRIMLPALKFLIVFVLAIRFMDAFRFFDTIYVLTAGGPGTATETLTMYTYALAFRFFDVGKASALGVITLLFVACITAGMLWAVFRRKGDLQ
ncbi:sugar ABC transporter permease [Rhizobium sp. TRM96647]|uniref:carbohydrate ABC transporter permease n=1 Tax=unclassified Rhizobium TaxID=2613769 RepID=UPI0021E80991|nr:MULTISPECIES: sugar ABC transporter permease [unclassified Rhizobium]MCV3737340.1 sugar ABC transporter permease [Rhizobium sp. TRM96647]MCV3759324.1 sugar ABC transporter permease [Rhizobium sp. TRM96650]